MALRYEGRELTSWLPRVAASFYRQKYSFPDDTLTSQIVLGSSWTLVPDPIHRKELPAATDRQSVVVCGRQPIREQKFDHDAWPRSTGYVRAVCWRVADDWRRILA